MGMRYQYRQAGQTLVMLLVFMTVATVLTTSATAVAVINAQSSVQFTLSEVALRAAESGAENALLRLERNPSYTGETLTIGSATAIITISGSATKIIISEGVAANLHRKLQITASYTGDTLTVTDWKEMP